MAEQIANDPSFKEVTQSLQASMGAGGSGGMPGMPPPGMPAPGGAPDMSQMDPSKYMEAMSGMFQNKNFMEMAERLGKTIIEVRGWHGPSVCDSEQPSHVATLLSVCTVVNLHFFVCGLRGGQERTDVRMALSVAAASLDASAMLGSRCCLPFRRPTPTWRT